MERRCPNCKHRWQPRRSPRVLIECPRCKKALAYRTSPNWSRYKAMPLCQCQQCSYKWESRGKDRSPARCPSCSRRDWSDKAAKRAAISMPLGSNYSLLRPRMVAEKKRAAKAAATEEASRRKKASA